jgi:hypothetical protein
MRIMRLTDVHQGEHHKNEGLQGDNQNVKDGPN